ncbi:Golgin subfamily A member 7/ERF4 [Penicillium atrosanguineum]|nr:Golgin subfamily A member 7/ERF4 [Penicillium atrosanguineum]
MRWSLLFTLVLFFLCGVSLAAPAVGLGERDVDAAAILDKRENQDTTMTATSNDAMPTTTTATGTQVTSTEATGTRASTITDSAKNTSTSRHTSQTSPTNAATTVPSLDGVGSSSASSQNNTQSAYSGGLPIKPEVTPALGVGGFILLVLGAALALIGIRKQWVYIFLSTAFCAALGVTVSHVYLDYNCNVS